MENLEVKNENVEVKNEEVAAEQPKPTKQYFEYLRKVLVHYANYFATLDKEKIDIPTFLINYSLSLSDFVKDVVMNKNADEIDALDAFTKVTMNFLSILCTQNAQFYEQGEEGMNIAMDSFRSGENFETNDLVFNMLRIETAERINIFIQYAMCLTLLNKLHSTVTEKDIELIFKLKLKDLK